MVSERAGGPERDKAARRSIRLDAIKFLAGIIKTGRDHRAICRGTASRLIASLFLGKLFPHEFHQRSVPSVTACRRSGPKDGSRTAYRFCSLPPVFFAARRFLLIREGE